MHEQLFIIANVYAPNKDKPEFFVNLFQQLNEIKGRRVIIGDFNLVLDTELDAKSVHDRTYINKTNSCELLKQYMEESMLSDIWRDRNSDKLLFTWRHTKTAQQGSRIDYTLIDTSISDWVRDTEIRPGYKSDHSYLVTEINPNSFKRGPGLWKLNNTALKDLAYVNRINMLIDTHVTSSTNLTPHESWEAVKLEIIYESKEYTRKKA